MDFSWTFATDILKFFEDEFDIFWVGSVKLM